MAAATVLSDNLSRGSTEGASELFSMSRDPQLEAEGSASAARLFAQSCVELMELQTSVTDRDLVRNAMSAFAQTLDGAVLSMSVLQTDENWTSTATRMAESGEIDQIYHRYLSFGGLNFDFLTYVALVGASGRADAAELGAQVSVNYQKEAVTSRAEGSITRAVDLAHHVNAVASYAQVLRNERHGVDEENRQRANEITMSCGTRLLSEVLTGELHQSVGVVPGENYALFLDPESAADFFRLREERPKVGATWRQLLRPDAVLDAFAAAVDAREKHPFVIAPSDALG